MTRLKPFFALTVALSLSLLPGPGEAASDHDWPTWRHDANRSAASPIELPAEMFLQWKRELPAPRPAFGEDIRLCFDVSYEPVVMGKTMFAPSMVTDSVTALDTETGRAKWVFYADGPVRLAPVAWQGNVYFISDDGHLYCVEAEEGRLLWKFCGVPAGRESYKFLGDERLISRWPARGAPVLVDGTVYFASGVWPFEGTFVYAVDAKTGKQVWADTKCGFIKDGLNDHGGRWDGGLSPQGYLAVIREKLIVPTGRSLPAFFDRKSGKMEPYTSGWGGRDGLAKGSWYVSGTSDYLCQSGDLYAVGSRVESIAGPYEHREIWSFEDFAEHAGVPVETVGQWVEKELLEAVERDGERLIRVPERPEISYLAWWTRTPPPGEQHVLATYPRVQIDPANDKALGLFRELVLTEDAVYYSRPTDDGEQNRNRQPAAMDYEEIVAYDTTKASWGVSCEDGWGDPMRFVVWKNLRFDPLWRLPSKLKVHIKAGSRLYAGSEGAVAAIDVPTEGNKPAVSWQSEIEGTPSRMLAADGKLFVVTKEGAICCFGGKETEARVHAATEPGPPTTDQWTTTAGDVLKRTGVTDGFCLALGIGTGRLVEELARQSKLYIVVLEPDREKVDAARRKLDRLGLYGTRVHVVTGDLVSLRLAPYMASLTISEDLAETGFTQGKPFGERLFSVMRPYGGAACLPIPEGEHEAFAKCVSGAEVSRAGQWTLLVRAGALPGSDDWTHDGGTAGHTFTSQDQRVKPPFAVLWFGGAADWVGFHPPSTVVIGGRMLILNGSVLHAIDVYTGRLLWKESIPGSKHYIAAAEDAVYVIRGDVCLRIDPATGSQIGEIPLPKPAKQRSTWMDVRVWENSLIGTSGSRLFSMDRHSGEMRWKFQAECDRFGYAVGSGKVFAVECWSAQHQRRGEEGSDVHTITALDLSDGNVLWQTKATTPESPPTNKKPSHPIRPLEPQLTYCEANDVLLFTTVKWIASAFKGVSGDVLWTKPVPSRGTGVGGYQAPVLLPDMLIPYAGTSYDPLSGSPLPEEQWQGMKVRGRGCGRVLASTHIVTVRDAHASYFDLATGRLTYLRGTRAGCRHNLIPAGGLLNAPNFAAHCTCNWPIYVSFALAPMPEAAAWEPRPANGE